MLTLSYSIKYIQLRNNTLNKHQSGKHLCSDFSKWYPADFTQTSSNSDLSKVLAWRKQAGFGYKCHIFIPIWLFSTPWKIVQISRQNFSDLTKVNTVQNQSMVCESPIKTCHVFFNNTLANIIDVVHPWKSTWPGLLHCKAFAQGFWDY